jgi:hypothetical protein
LRSIRRIWCAFLANAFDCRFEPLYLTGLPRAAQRRNTDPLRTYGQSPIVLAIARRCGAREISLFAHRAHRYRSRLGVSGTSGSNPLSSSGESANHRFRWVFHPIPDAGPLQRDRRPRPGPRGCNWRGVQRRQAFFQTAPGWCPVPVHPIKAIQPRGQLMAWRYCSVARGCWRELHICRDDGCEPRHGGRPHRSLQALARRLQLGPLELCSAVVFPMRGVSVLKPLMHSRHTGDRGSNPIKVRAPGQFIRPSRASGNPGISVTCPEPPLSRGDDCERARNFITTSPASTRAEEPSRKDSPPQFFVVR